LFATSDTTAADLGQNFFPRVMTCYVCVSTPARPRVSEMLKWLKTAEQKGGEFARTLFGRAPRTEKKTDVARVWDFEWFLASEEAINRWLARSTNIQKTSDVHSKREIVAPGTPTESAPSFRMCWHRHLSFTPSSASVPPAIFSGTAMALCSEAERSGCIAFGLFN